METTTTTIQDTVTRRTLTSRGWTDTHIKRILGAPDLIESLGTREIFRWRTDRVAHAEATDPKLIRRLAQVAAKKEETIAAKVTVGGEIVFRKVGGEWMLQGMDLTEGETVTVTKRDGTTTEATVGRIVEDRDGVRLATVGRKPRRQSPRPAVGRAATPTEPSRSILDGGPWTEWEETRHPERFGVEVGMAPRVGQILTRDGMRMEVVATRPHWVSEDDPAMWGSHLLGHEGARATMVAWRPAQKGN